MKDLANDIKIVNVITPAVVGAADVQGADVDRLGYDSVTFVISVGAEGDTLSGSIYFDFILQHGDAASPTTPVAKADIVVPKDQSVVLSPDTTGIVLNLDDPAEAPVLVKVGYKGGKRYLSLKADKTGTHTNGTPMTALAILGNPVQRPVA